MAWFPTKGYGLSNPDNNWILLLLFKEQFSLRYFAYINNIYHTLERKTDRCDRISRKKFGNKRKKRKEKRKERRKQKGEKNCLNEMNKQNSVTLVVQPQFSFMCVIYNVVGNWLNWHILKPQQNVKIPLWWRFLLFSGSLLFLIFLVLQNWTSLYRGHNGPLEGKGNVLYWLKIITKHVKWQSFPKPLSQVGAINSNEIWAVPNWISFFIFFTLRSVRF